MPVLSEVKVIVGNKLELYRKLSDVTRMLLDELESLPEYGLKGRKANGAQLPELLPIL